jgi:restriction endonuclease S subunit
MSALLQPLYLREEELQKLPSRWRPAKVDDIAELLKSGRLYDENSVAPTGDVPVVNQSMDDYHGYHSDEPGVLASDERPVSTFANHTCAMRLMRRPFSCIQNIFSRVGKPGICDTVFFHYSTLGRVRLSGYKGHHPIYRDTWIPLPPIEVQQRLASILSAYDGQMENNRRRIGLLEKAARLLYEEWFVRLRFPGHEHTPVIKGLPKGWELKPLNAICPDLREAANPTDLEPGTPYIGLEHMPRRSITLLDWGTAEDVTSTKLRYLAGDILFGKIRPYFHKVGFALTDGVTSSDAIVLRPSEPLYYSFALLTVSSDWFVNIVSKTAKEGSKMPRADWNLMEMHSLVVPPRALLETLNETIKPMLDQLRTLALQNLKLRAARDLLLPRLMSGEIEV